MAVTDVALHYGAESTYGTAASLTRSFEAKTDEWKRKQEWLESVGFRAGIHTLRSDRSVTINMGAEGAIELDVLNKGMGLLLRDLFSTTTGPTQQGATTAYVQTHAVSKDGPLTSSTIQMIRPFADGSTQQFTHKGCSCTGWELTCETGQFLVLKAMFDAQDVDTTTAAGTATYPASTSPFHWGQCVVTVAGGAVDMRKLSLKADYGMNTDRRFLKGSVLKKQPRRSKLPTYEGSLEGEFESLAHYNRFVSGGPFTAQFKWTGALIEGVHNFEFTVDMPAIEYRGESPQVSLDEMPKQEVPFRVLHDGTNAAMTITVKSTDTSL